MVIAAACVKVVVVEVNCVGEVVVVAAVVVIAAACVEVVVVEVIGVGEVVVVAAVVVIAAACMEVMVVEVFGIGEVVVVDMSNMLSKIENIHLPNFQTCKAFHLNMNKHGPPQTAYASESQSIGSTSPLPPAFI